MKQIVSLNVAQYLRTGGKKWKIRLEYVGSNLTNKSGASQKFWEAYQIAPSTNVIIGWGKIGTVGQTVIKDFEYVLDKVQSKIDKGYEYAPGTIFQREHLTEGHLADPQQNVQSISLSGPFALIHKMVREPAGVVAFDAEGKRLMKLTHDSAVQIAAQLNLRIDG